MNIFLLSCLSLVSFVLGDQSSTGLMSISSTGVNGTSLEDVIAAVTFWSAHQTLLIGLIAAVVAGILFTFIYRYVQSKSAALYPAISTSGGFNSQQLNSLYTTPANSAPQVDPSAVLQHNLVAITPPADATPTPASPLSSV